MKKIATLLVLAVSLSSNIYGQALGCEWVVPASSGSNDAVTSIVTDASGNVYETGYFSTTVDFDPNAGNTVNLISNGAYDVFIRKLDQNGNLQWARSVGGTGNDVGWDIALDGSGNVCLTGYSISSVDFDPGPGTSTIAASSAGSPFILKLDNAGNYVNAVVLQGGTVLNEGRTIDVDNNDNIVIGGVFRATFDCDPGSGTQNLSIGTSNNRAFIVKLSSSLALVWGGNFEGTGTSVCYSMAVTSTGDIYVGGNFTNTVDFDPSAGTNSVTAALGTGGDLFIAKFNSSGVLQWRVTAGASGSLADCAWSLDTDASGAVYAAGSFGTTVDFDPSGSFANAISAGGMDVFVYKLNSNGSFGWVTSLGGTSNDVANAINVDASGFVHAGGYFQGTVDFDPGAGTVSRTSNGAEDMFVLRLTSTGQYSSVGACGATGTDIVNAISCNNNTFYASGQFANIVDFDPSGITNSVSALSTRDGVSFKWSICTSGPPTPAAINGSNTVCANTSNIYSVPAVSGATSYSWSLPPGWTYSGNAWSSTVTLVASNTGGTLSVMAGNACGGSSVISFNVQVEAVPAVPSVVSGPDTACIGSTQTYSVTNTPGVTYNWTAPSLTGSSTSNSLTGTVNGSGNIAVTASNNCGTSGTSSTSVVAITVPAAPSTITGTTTLCEASTEIYTVVSTPGVLAYTWTLPGGWTGTSTSNSINATASATSGVISVTADNACGSSSPVQLPVNVTMLPVFTATSGDTICAGNSAQLTASVTSGTISWYANATGGPALGTGNMYTTPALTTTTSYYIEADNGGCLQAGSRPAVLVTVNPMPTTGVNVTSGYLESDQTGAVYQWLDCNNSLGTVAGATSQQYFPPLNGTFAVSVDLNGCVDTSACEVFISSVDFGDNNSSTFNVYPNPASTELFISGENPATEIIITDLTGRIVLTETYSNRINVTGLTMGMYYIIIKSENQIFTHKFDKR